MNCIHSLVTTGLFALAALVPSLASAAPAGTLPQPVKIVHPTGLNSTYRDAEVTVRFTLDKEGNPHNVAPATEMPKDLAARLLPAIAQWKFTPARDAAGRPQQRQVILPLKLVDGKV